MTYLSKNFVEGGIYKFNGFLWYYDSVGFSELKCLAEHSIDLAVDKIQKIERSMEALEVYKLEFLFLKEIVVKYPFKTLDQQQAIFGSFGAFLVNSQILYIEESSLHNVLKTQLL